MSMESPTRRMNLLSIAEMPLSHLHAQGRELDVQVGALDDDGNTILSPAGLLYSMKNLSRQEKDDFNETFFTEDIDAFQMVLHDYSMLQDTAKFEVLELTRHTISIPASRGAEPRISSCNKCGTSAHRCRAGLWLLDQIAGQVMGNTVEPLVMSAKGYAEELGDIFEAITDHDIDTLANGLQCNDTYRSWGPVPRRVQESREILASLHQTPVKMYRQDLYGPGDDDDDIVQQNDLEKTIFRMLLHNDQFFKYFLSVTKPDRCVNNPFRKLQHKAECIVAKYVARASDADTQSIGPEKSRHARWCAKSLKAVVKNIRVILTTDSEPLEDWLLDSAAEALIHILDKLVELNVGMNPNTPSGRDLNLFSWLMGEADSDFIVDILHGLIPKEILVLHEEKLLDIRDRLQGVPQSWYDKFCKLIDTDRRSRAPPKTPAKHKRGSDDDERSAKRAK
ncbi:uncharacterized protein B0I36DRAFT_346956 [Microdochium trichocladiopsis]|uniref:Uncharacterized protein n=1 Tax=Microdochium trichocladiopsis TaxID=1682393 RepID=A0A9P8YB34_9PEZI|nr:uncharacterized protein B0I36DRAFT_346956 [Microdochium trichocladiopsis]KAH7035121.1 hypothetical protein B0I36DRAFT_346956 [Microdochium trichocladiopsis]